MPPVWEGARGQESLHPVAEGHACLTKMQMGHHRFRAYPEVLHAPLVTLAGWRGRLQQERSGGEGITQGISRTNGVRTQGQDELPEDSSFKPL